MCGIYIILYFILTIISNVFANGILGCGGFIKSHVPIDFMKVEVRLYTKQGILKEKTNCAPNNGYYFIPLYDKGEYVLQLEPPPGWSFTPTKIHLVVDGVTDLCSQGKDINFIFQGFGITGKVESVGLNSGGPSGVLVKLVSDSEVRQTTTDKEGNFFFTPVYPGKYTVLISHPQWYLIKDSILVQVAEGNTELPLGSLVVGGYDVTGSIKSEEQPVKGAYIILFEFESSKVGSQVENCNKTKLSVMKSNYKQLCHVISDDKGIFVFPYVSPGKYFVTPFYEKQNIHFIPDEIQFSVQHDSVVLTEVFEIVGFSVTGKLLNSDKKRPIAGAKIFLNDTEVAVSKSDGLYILEKIKANIYKITVEADQVKFEEQIVNINPNILSLPTIEPSKYQVCGVVLNENPQTVLVSELNSSKIETVLTEKNSGKFCVYLSPGKYSVKVKVSDADKAAGVQFFPLSHTVEVVASPLDGYTFSQLKSTITGKVRCIREKDCSSIQVVLKPNIINEEVGLHERTAELKDSSYKFSDVRPGTYEISLTENKLCWRDSKYTISVTSTEEVMPVFEQVGYYVMFTSSHNTKCYYKNATSSSDQTSVNYIDIPKGKFSYCVSQPGNYEFIIDSCHTYETDKVLFNTDAETNEIHLNALKHEVIVGIEAKEATGNVTVTISIGRTKTEEGPLIYQNGQYVVKLFLSPSESAILIPHSDIFYFNPPILSINGNTECVNLGTAFKAVKGRVFEGKIVPPLAGVLITVETENSEALMDETDDKGKYKFPPLDDTKTYKISAKKSSYILVGPDDQGTFFAHKLAEIVVEVLDEANNLPLQGTLISLSGGDSYRSNLQTGEDGKIKFQSLSPSDYFLKPMMKEYMFEPNSKIITVKEGATVDIQLKGKRIAYSAFGQVSSLNGEPEEGMTVLANGLNNCSHISEEATSETSGQFRIRGLHSHCSYTVQVGGSLEHKQPIERAVPVSIIAHVQNEDISGLRFIIFRATINTDILLKIYTENPEHYKLLRVKLMRESSPTTLIHTTKIDISHLKVTKDNNPGIMLHMPSVPMDLKAYSLHLESSSTIRNKANVFYFTADKPVVYGELEFTIKTATSEQQIKQTSIWTLIIIFGMIFLIYNIDIVANLLREMLSKYELPNVFNKYRSLPNSPEYTINKNEIEQLLQNINAVKKKPKPRKV